MNTTATRRLAAILAADVVGYSRLMGADEEGTHERLKAHLREVVDPKIRDHHGRIVISDAAGAWPRPPQNDCASQEGATPKPGAGARSHVALLRTLAFRVGRRVRISFAPAASLSQRRTPGLRRKRPALWRHSAGGSGREKGRAGCELGLLRPFSLTGIDAVPPPESSDVYK
jgi:hypothetical protein